MQSQFPHTFECTTRCSSIRPTHSSHNHTQRPVLLHTGAAARRTAPLRLRHLVRLHLQVRVAVLLHQPLGQRLLPVGGRRLALAPHVVLVVGPHPRRPPVHLAVDDLLGGAQVAGVPFVAHAAVVVSLPLQTVDRLAVDEVLVEATLDALAVVVLLLVQEARPDLRQPGGWVFWFWRLHARVGTQISVSSTHRPQIGGHIVGGNVGPTASGHHGRLFGFFGVHGHILCPVK